MSGAKFKVVKFDRSNDFGLWKIKMKVLLVQHGLEEALKAADKLTKTQSSEEKKMVTSKALSTIQLSISNKVLREERLYQLKMNLGTSVGDHVDLFNQIVMDLANVWSRCQGGIIRISKAALVLMKGRLQKGLYVLQGKASMTAVECPTPEEKYLDSLGDGGDFLGTNKMEKHRFHALDKASKFLISNEAFYILGLVMQIESTCRGQANQPGRTMEGGRQFR
ncbi:hypothetical protein CRG98_011759 [Punica granatum]|uniref:Retrovirus-related Pol polyprotein from transposon TNT 1-94 n=1 Tax=Punica granatum TaxID=22663 RepID=A0A2I0KHS2_PUNGR|nr:hypothetical protein CRG98_011759 [Punica granatum]